MRNMFSFDICAVQKWMLAHCQLFQNPIFFTRYIYFYLNFASNFIWTRAFPTTKWYRLGDPKLISVSSTDKTISKINFHSAFIIKMFSCIFRLTLNNHRLLIEHSVCENRFDLSADKSLWTIFTVATHECEWFFLVSVEKINKTKKSNAANVFYALNERMAT